MDNLSFCLFFSFPRVKSALDQFTWRQLPFLRPEYQHPNAADLPEFVFNSPLIIQNPMGLNFPREERPALNDPELAEADEEEDGEEEEEEDEEEVA